MNCATLSVSRKRMEKIKKNSTPPYEELQDVTTGIENIEGSLESKVHGQKQSTRRQLGTGFLCSRNGLFILFNTVSMK